MDKRLIGIGVVVEGASALALMFTLGRIFEGNTSGTGTHLMALYVLLLVGMVIGIIGCVRKVKMNAEAEP